MVAPTVDDGAEHIRDVGATFGEKDPQHFGTEHRILCVHSRCNGDVSGKKASFTTLRIDYRLIGIH